MSTPSIRSRRTRALAIAAAAVTALFAVGTASADTGPAPFIGVPGTQLYANGDVNVEIEGGDAADLNELYLELYADNLDWQNPAGSLLGNNKAPTGESRVWNSGEGRGKFKVPKKLDPSKELVFYIKGYLPDGNGGYSPEADFIFYSGPGSRNTAPCHNTSASCADGEAHAAVRDLGRGSAKVGFEDLPNWSSNPYWISDWDFNDLVFTVDHVNVPANRGFITGGGWIDSAAGAYTYNYPQYIRDGGKATFGFVAKYANSSDAPKGNIEMNLHFSDKPKFHSTNLYWLDVAGQRARVRGTGELGGHLYDFLMTVVDGEATGGDGKDRFRMKIWDTWPTWNVYYNWLDGSDLIQSVQSLASGSIVLHK